MLNIAIKNRDRDVFAFCFVFAEFEDAFSVYDKQARGVVKTSSVFKLIRSLGYNPTEAKVWVYMNELGLTGNLAIGCLHSRISIYLASLL